MGERFETVTEHPDTLIYEGCQRSALNRMPMPKPQWDSPIAEHTPGYMQKAYPFELRTGDGDPFQERPVDITKLKSNWEPNWLDWLAQQPDFQKRPDAMFMIHGRSQRIKSRMLAKIAIHNEDPHRKNLPTRDEIFHIPQNRNETAKK